MESLHALSERLERALAALRATEEPPPSGTPAAVLVLLREGPAGLEVLFLKRPETMRHHAGQWAFPGGRAEPTDAGPVATALREAQEEVGLDPEAVRVLGALPAHRTLTSDFSIRPVVGALRYEAPLAPSPREVAELAWLPLEGFLAPCSIERLRGDVFWRLALAYRVEGRVVWGATARILRQLARALERP